MGNLKGRIASALLAAGVIAGAVPSVAQDRTEAVELRLEADKPGTVIDRNLFGQFAEHLGAGIYGGIWVGKNSPIPNVRGIRTDVVEALRALKVPNVRWPGGCYADEYHWRDGVGAQRRPTVNGSWGGVVESNDFGTDEFMDFVQQVGTEAYVSVNMGSGTVKEAADWMAYMTAPADSAAGAERAANGHPDPYKVKYLGIGNESWSCGGAMRPEFYADQMKLYARFVRNFHPDQAEGEPEQMQRIAVGPGFPNPAYTRAVMEAWKSHDWAWAIEGVSLHRYTNGGWPPAYSSTTFGNTEYATLVAETLGMKEFIEGQAKVMDEYDPEKKVPLVVDEWGVWLEPLPGTNPGFLAQQNSMRDAVIAALNINIFARHADRVRMANIAQMINVLQAMVLTDGSKMVLTPTYHVFHMYVPFQDATFLPLEFDAGTVTVAGKELPRVDAIAARGKDGKVWIAVTNVDPDNPARVTLAVDGARASGASGQVLTAPAVDTINTFDNPDAVKPAPIAAKVAGGRLTIDLPAKSVAVLSLGE